MVTTLTVGILADLLTAAFALYVATRVHQGVRRGLTIQRTLWFWYGMVVFLVLDGGYALATLYVEVPRIASLLALMIRRFAFVIGTAALVWYLLDFAGRQVKSGLLPYYAVLLTYVEAVSLYQYPRGHQQLPWSVQFLYARETPGLLDFFTGVAIFLPLLLASVAAIQRLRLQTTRGQRFRLLSLTLGVISFCAGIIIGFWDNDWYWYGLFENRLAFTIAAGMLFALRPPWVVRRFWGVKHVTRIDQWPV